MTLASQLFALLAGVLHVAIFCMESLWFMQPKVHKRLFNRVDLEAQPQGVECRKDGGVIDEIPGAYKDIDVVMDNQKDLVEIVHTLKQIVCVKG